VIDFKATLIDGNYHDVDFGSVLAFEIAAPRGVSAMASPRAQCKLLEPIMKVEVVTARRLHGATASADLNSRRGQNPRHGCARQNAAGHRCHGAASPNMFGYVNTPAVDDPGPALGLTP